MLVLITALAFGLADRAELWTRIGPSLAVVNVIGGENVGLARAEIRKRLRILHRVVIAFEFREVDLRELAVSKVSREVHYVLLLYRKRVRANWASSGVRWKTLTRTAFACSGVLPRSSISMLRMVSIIVTSAA